MIRTILNSCLAVCAGMVVLTLYGTPAFALPAYARQTGQNCVACHVSFPELTPYGRLFKLTGYTIGTRQDIPLAGMIQAGVASTTSNRDASGNAINPKNDDVAISQGSVFIAGKATDNIGAWLPFTQSSAAAASGPA